MAVASVRNRPGSEISFEGYPSLLSLSLAEGRRASFGQQVRGTFAVSLILHLCLLLLITGLRFSSKGERPLASYQVSLVTLPAPSRVVEPSPVPPAAKVPPPPAPVAKPLPPKPIPASPPPREARVAKSRPENLMQDVLRGIELPPEAPKFADLSPARVTKVDPPPQKLRKEIDTLLNNLKVPDVPAPTKEPPQEIQERQPRPSVAKEIDKELQKLQQPTVAPAAPAVAAKVPELKRPETVIKVPGMAPGFNQYLARVQLKISSQWNAPPVDLTGRPLEVIIRFRLHRSGTVSDVMIERTSGNEYYDLAGKRAVLNADPLPAFPREMADAYLDAHFSFAVGERSG
ncbi:MAG: energy transducer TonB [Nitrospiraceae bacterium]